MANIQENTNPIISNQAVLSNTGVIANTTAVNNQQNVLGANSPAANATRVAQANTRTSKTKMPSDKEILKILFPGEMDNVNVFKFKDVPSKLVKPETDFDAWTNSSEDMFLKEKPKLDEFERIFVLYHEGLHILQAKNNPPLTTFQEMMKFEVLAYGKSTGWLDTAQAKALKSGRKGYDETVTKARRGAAFVFKVANEATEMHIIGMELKSTAAEIDQGYLETMIEYGLLPNKYVDEALTIRYTIEDLYNDTNKTFFIPKEDD